ncbi:hypothetical protein [Kitasatospora sp. NPDC056531]|uniref:hypothetical protein n=1 Tax=Kitasatospora sp. NPDC056531 TaxID=3345856 RepID=UPI0036C7177A
MGLAVLETLAVGYPAPIHDRWPGEPCGYDAEDPVVRRPDEEAKTSLLAKGVYARRM